MEYEDIGQSREWEDIEYINKGWSDDKKYKIKTRENEELLLKISDIGQFAKKKKEAKKKIRCGGESPAGGKGEKGSQRAPPTAA